MKVCQSSVFGMGRVNSGDMATAEPEDCQLGMTAKAIAMGKTIQTESARLSRPTVGFFFMTPPVTGLCPPNGVHNPPGRPMQNLLRYRAASIAKAPMLRGPIGPVGFMRCWAAPALFTTIILHQFHFCTLSDVRQLYLQDSSIRRLRALMNSIACCL